MTKNQIIISTIIAFFISFLVLELSDLNSIHPVIKRIDINPKNGFVPDEETAVKIAEIIFNKTFNQKVFNSKPFKVELKDDSIWVIEGTLKPRTLGGVPYIEIRKSDCKVICVKHSGK